MSQETWIILSPSRHPVWLSGQLCSNCDLLQVVRALEFLESVFLLCGLAPVLCSLHELRRNQLLFEECSLFSLPRLLRLSWVWIVGQSEKTCVCNSKSMTGPPDLLGISVFEQMFRLITWPFLLTSAAHLLGTPTPHPPTRTHTYLSHARADTHRHTHTHSLSKLSAKDGSGRATMWLFVSPHWLFIWTWA